MDWFCSTYYTFNFSITSRRSLRSSEYNGIFNVQPNNIVTIDTTHEKFDPSKRSKLVCHFIVCDAWKNCEEECPARNKARRQKRADIVKEIKDSSKLMS